MDVNHLWCISLRQQEGGEGQEGSERELLRRSYSQLPYFLGKPTQDRAVIKSGYCVKQGAVVSVVDYGGAQ